MTALKVILSVLLFILKAIGIILLAVLALLLIILISVLFVPVRYKAEGSISAGVGNTEDYDASNDMQRYVSGNFKAGVSWLFHIISIKVWTEENKLYFYGKLFGKRIVDSKNPRPVKEKKKSNHKKRKPDTLNEKLKEKSEKAVEKATENKSIREHNDKINAEEAAEQNEKINISEEKENEEEYTKDYYKKSAMDKLREKYHNILTKIINIKFKFLEMCDKIKNVNGIREEFVSFLTTEESRDAIGDIKCRIVKILLHIMPSKLMLNAAYGLTDPAVTGNVYGALCILLNRYGSSVNINPQFNDVEKPFVCGDFKCKGSIRAAILLMHAIKIYKIKRLKEFIAFAKGKGKENGR